MVSSVLLMLKCYYLLNVYCLLFAKDKIHRLWLCNSFFFFSIFFNIYFFLLRRHKKTNINSLSKARCLFFEILSLLENNNLAWEIFTLKHTFHLDHTVKIVTQSLLTPNSAVLDSFKSKNAKILNSRPLQCAKK